MNWNSIGKYTKNTLSIIGFLAILNIVPKFKSYDLKLTEYSSNVEMIKYTWWKQKSESHFIFYNDNNWHYYDKEDKLKTVPYKNGIYEIIDNELDDSDSIFGY